MTGDTSLQTIKIISTANRCAYSRTLSKALKNGAKASGWKSVQGLLFKEHGQWFVTCALETSLLSAQTQVRLSAKPMAIDPIFWDIFDLPENRGESLSFRALGAWTCPSLDIAEISVPEQPSATATASDALRIAAEQLDAAPPLSLSWFAGECRKVLDDQPAILASLITTLIADNRRAQALELCQQAEASGETGGFVNRQVSFVQAAARWLNRSMADQAPHDPF
ncbi:hypothetical protein [Brevundimonas diminuta]|uniref:hypothetical protein n=1 Tax=Brevundimonas diminuta TaxID=293 RepID=UPI00320AFC3A